MPAVKPSYTFATLTLSFDSLGVPFLSERTKALIDAMSKETAKAVNAEAWKSKKTATRIANRHCNWSINGNIGLYEHAAHEAMVAELVCKATYKRMMAA